MAATVCLVLLFGISTVLADSCRISTPYYNLVGDTVRWPMTIESGHSCIYGLRFANVTMEKVRLVSKPQSGHAALLGWGFGYSAGADAEGKDAFTLRISGKINNRFGNSTIEVMVTIVNPRRERPGPRAVERPLPPPTQPAATAPQVTEQGVSVPPGASLPPCPVWDWSKGAPPPMRPPFDRSKLYCPPPPFKPPGPPIGCICPE